MFQMNLTFLMTKEGQKVKSTEFIKLISQNKFQCLKKSQIFNKSQCTRFK